MKTSLSPRQISVAILLAAGALSLSVEVRAADIFKANINAALNLGTSWFTNSPPTQNIPGASDVAVWSNGTGNPTAANCTNTLGANASWLGMRLDNPRGVPVDISGANLLTLGTAGITNTSSNAGRDLSLRCAVVLGASQTWDSGTKVTFISGQLSGAAGNDLTIVNNSGTVRLQTSNTFSGQVFHNGGTLFLDHNNALGNCTNLAVGSTYNSGSGFNAGTLVSLNGVSIPATASLSLTGSVSGPVSSTLNCAIGTSTWNGPITLNGNGTVVFNNAGNTLNLPGNITGNGFSGSLHLRGAGSTVLGGTINIGSAEFRKRDNGGRVTINSSGNTWGQTTLLFGSIILGANNALPVTTTVTNDSANTGLLDLAGFNQKVAGIYRSGAGPIIVTNGASATTSTFTFEGSLVDTFSGSIVDGAGKVALTVNSGTLVLTGPNTYSGNTLVSGGALVVPNTQTGGGAFTVNDDTRLGVTAVGAGVSLNMASLTLGSSSGATNDFTLSGNPTVPVVNATNLTTQGTVMINVSGSGLAVGQFPLIKYSGGIGGSGYSFVLGTLPFGVSASLVNNTGNSSVDLNVTAAPALFWTGQVNDAWDIGLTTNWFDAVASLPAVYTEGLAVRFDDTATGATNVNLTTNLSPGGVTVSNVNLVYSFGGAGSIIGSGGLTKQGAGLLIVGVTNGYSGDTTISAGTFQLGISGAIPNGVGKGNVTLNGTLDLAGFSETLNGLSGSGIVDHTVGGSSTLSVGDINASSTFSGTLTNSNGSLVLAKVGGGALTLSGANSHAGGTTISAGTLRLGGGAALGTGPVTLNGGRISSDSATPRAVTNDVFITANSSLGDSANTGLLTFSGNVDLSAGAQKDLNFSSDVVLTGTMMNGSIAKLSPGALRVQNGGGVTLNADLATRDGMIVIDNATFTQSVGQFRLNGNVANGLVRVVVTNGGSLIVSAEQLRVGHINGDATTTNIIDIAATVDLQGTSGDNGKAQMGSKSARAVVNLRTNGLLRTRGVEHLVTSPFVSVSEFNFDGGTLQANAGPNGNSFMQGLTVATVLAGGAIVDSAGADIRIGQSFLNGGGGGGLLKLGAGKLSLNGANTYTGSTIVSNGTLGGIGVIAGPVLVTSGTELAPGSAVSGIGTLSVSNTVTLDSSICTMELNRTNLQNADLLAANSIVGVGATITVVNIGDDLQANDTFNLFDGPLSGSFVATNLPVLTGSLTWDTSQLGVNGTVTVVGTQPPPTNITHTVIGNELVLEWPNGQGWRLQLQTNSLSVGINTNWTIVTGATSPFTNVMNPANGSVFFRLIYP